MEQKRAVLLLEDGEVLEGTAFGADGIAIGEVVFNTGMTGYQEVLTDPSYYGQIVTQTYPMIGNYGINPDDVESKKVHVRGYIVREDCETPSNFRSAMTISEYLKKENIIALSGINTRKLTKKLRDRGVMNGAITTEYDESKKEVLLSKIRAYKITDAVKSVTTEKEKTYGESGKYKVVLMDFGYKKNILRSLIARNCSVTVVPGDLSAEEILKKHPDGIMLSNGPGDPEENVEIIENIKKLLKSGVPIFGICLGHQLTALAVGGKTEKLKFGHRGVNQPVSDFARGRTFVTSQNHGYAVTMGSIPEEIGKISHINANDQTVEGVKYEKYNCFTVQFHPEASAGPNDTSYLFDNFIDMMKGGK